LSAILEGASTERTGARRERPFKVVALVGIAALVGFVAYVVVTTESHHRAPSTVPASAPPSLPRGTGAPAFTLPRLGGGPAVSLATAHGHPVIVNFFASWCSNCREELHAVAAAAAAVTGTVAVIGIDTSDPDPGTAEHLLAVAGATYPVGVDRTAKVAATYDVQGVPVTYLLSATDRVQGVAFGRQTEKSLLAWARRLEGEAGGQ
jgi:cytochrome c biogenesis protein CcmG, thiol:disulfide interchange protein DsbE